MAPTLYLFMPSAYCRSVLLAAKALDVELDVKTVNLMEKEQLKPEFLAINPQHTVPTFVDGDLVLTESRAILTYLSSRYGKDDSLYPKDVITRAKIDGLLYFDCSTLTIKWRLVVHPVMRSTAAKPDEEAVKNLEEAVGWLDGKIAKHPDLYLAGTSQPTVADLAIVAWVSTYEAAGFDVSQHPHVAAWLARCKESIKGYKELNEPGAKKFGEIFKGLMKSRS
ncbi:glutathione S-transferase D7-like [Eriocheir sinensis]|uniref:glutathione S-transferase D7-like n=1 Tax=Eriocheir sinensis TaxID=95602 RepID=UPI0021C9182C|nr:glutathione S-transferase D7-like [Eriocheir sinensis]